jgi:8-oxo-dGTP pyrophosphatase MutT (NUDIX family)
MDNDSLRSAIAELVADVSPLDDREAADQAGILDWIASGEQLFRTVPPDTPPRHLVSYFVPFDEASRCVLLGDHRRSGLWLPPGGHAEDGEDPRDTVTREAYEELGIRARFHPVAQPLFLTVTPTRGTRSHRDVSLWFVLQLSKTEDLRPDPREYRGVGWFGLDEQRDWPADVYDPEMHRFAGKLRRSLGAGAARGKLDKSLVDVPERPEEAVGLDRLGTGPANGTDRVVPVVEQVRLAPVGSADRPGLRLGQMEADDWLHSTHRFLFPSTAQAGTDDRS